jgi:dihydroneopterin aldolase
MHGSLSINELRVAVHLGTTEAERALPQVVQIAVHLGFATPPLGCQTDAVDDTVPYDKLSTAIKQLCQTQPFCLIEALAQAIHQLVNDRHQPDRLCVEVRKCPPLSDVSSCTFSLGDGHPNTWSY